ncbi:ATP-binding protein [Actinomadura gamaensis]|uniref:ATP-binding protein n=1 Tax=Actinomadura gamaensis TaxID=1763541 RepID=A0ABV9U7K0_9ACTN
MDDLGLASDLVTDVCTAVSEISTNVFAHAYGGRARLVTSPVGLPELRLHLRGRRSELVVTAFDTAPWRGPCPGSPSRPDADAESGRGLEIVDALCRELRGAWGVRRSRARLGGVAVSGKAVYFAAPLPGGLPATRLPPPPGCHAATRLVEDELLVRGIGPVHRCEGWGMAVLSVRAEITLWARGNGLLLTAPSTGTVRYPFEDVAELAEIIVQSNEELDAR